MKRANPLLLFVALSGGLLAADEPVVFKSDVAMVRVDAQVLDHSQRAISGLTKDDFVLRQNGKVQEIRNFSKEDMPVDVLLLLDVSGSMRPHVERIAFASQEAMHVLGPDDRVAIMVFDRSTRVRLPFRRAGDEIYNELQRLLRQETFDGGTDITRAMFDAASYIARNGRRDARRAIVILTDDETERGNDVQGVERALDNSGTVLSLLLAPDAMGTGRGGGGMGYPRRHPSGGGYPGGGYPGGGGGGGGWGGLGGIILGRPGGGYPGGGYPSGGGRYPGGGGGNYPGGGGTIYGRTHSAGTPEIAKASGGDTMPVDDASALESTLARIRQRYALYFYLPADAKGAGGVEVSLAQNAQRRYSDAEVRYRRVNMTDGADSGSDVYASSGTSSGSGTWSRSEPDPVVVSQGSSDTDRDPDAPRQKRRPHTTDGSSSGPRGPVDEDGSYSGATTSSSNASRGGWPRAGDSSNSTVNDPGPTPQQRPADSKAKNTDKATDSSSSDSQTDSQPPAKKGGWRRATPDDQQPQQKQP